MIPVRDDNHLEEGLALRIGQYLTDTQLQALLTAFLNRVQDAEDMLWDVIASQQLSTYAPGSVAAGTAQGQASGPPAQGLLQLADLVRCPTEGLTTTQLAFFLGIWRQARRSKGRSEDLIQILATAFPPAGDVPGFTYDEGPLLAYQATVLQVPDETLLGPLAQALTIARNPGVNAVLAWGQSGWVTPSTMLFFGDSVGGLVGSGVDDSVSGGHAKGLLTASVV